MTKKYRSAKELRIKVDEYFADIKSGKIKDPVTMSGLILSLGVSKPTFYKYAKEKKFQETIAFAKLMVENAYEVLLVEDGKAGSIFAMKNLGGWSDKQELDITANGKIVIENYNKEWTK